MTERNNRLRKAIESRSSQQKVADVLGISRQAVNIRLNKNEDVDSIEFIKAVSELTGFTFEWLISGTGPEHANVQEPAVEYKNSAFSMLEKLVQSQQTTIELMDKRLKAVEEQVKVKK